MTGRKLLLAAAALTWSANTFAVTYYVSAHAAAGGDGTKARPFASLEAVEGASRAGDSIIVLPSASSVPPLDGGIALKPGQRLTGAGPAVISRVPGSDAPRISNTNDSRIAGDVVRMANASAVNNLVIVGARRSGIYGLNVNDVRIQNNDISGTNTSCTPGLLIYFPAESRWAPLANGFAAIMMDYDSSRASLDVDGNFIHDSACGDGIDIRAGGNARVVADLDGNVITRLKQGATVGSLLGIGLQTRDAAVLIASSAHNSETYLGNLFDHPSAAAGDAPWPSSYFTGADCEGLFTNQTGGSIVWHIERNTFAHGIGGTSCNGAEFLLSAGKADLHAVIRDSIFEDNPGDMIEENNLGADSVMDVKLDNVTVRHATHVLPQSREPAVPTLAFDSFTSRSVCMSQFSVGRRAITRFHMIRSHFSDCAGDGILAFHANLPELGIGPGASSVVDIDQSSIVQVGEYAVHWINYAALDELELKVQESRLDGADEHPAVAVDSAAGAQIRRARIDLGGGVLGSLGMNCFKNSEALRAGPKIGGVTYASNWWGTPSVGGRGLEGGRLAVPPASCLMPEI